MSKNAGISQAIIRGTGGYLPKLVWDNAKLETMVDTSDAWIRERTGIEQRHIAADGELTSDLAVAAATKALQNAGVSASELDMIIVATTTPDNTFPSVACKVQAKLGAMNSGAMDVQAVCTGFVYAMATANSFIRSGQCRRVLVIGADKLSSIVDWEDRGTAILFGDGAGAMVLEAAPAPAHATQQGILAAKLYADGTEEGILYADNGPARGEDRVGKLRMAGPEVFKHAVVKLGETTKKALEEANFSVDALDWVIPHQANQRILDATMKRLKLPNNRLISYVAQHANTSAASIPLAFAQAVEDGLILRGQLIALPAIGGGLTWGAVILRY